MQGQTLVLVVLGVFVGVFAVIWGAYYLFVVRDEQRMLGLVRRRLRMGRGGKPSPTSGLVAQQPVLSAIGPLNAILGHAQSPVKKLQPLIDQSGVPITVGTLLLACGVVCLLTFALVARSTGSALLALVPAAIVPVLPIMVIRYLRTRRLRQFEDQFPEALDLISRSLRAGHAFTTGIELVATEMKAPIAPEFRLLYDRQNYGMPVPDALKSFADRIPVLDARFFVTALLIQRESGGNLSEVLDNLSGVIRERQRVKRQMRVLSAHGRITGWILVSLPPALAIMMMSTSPVHRETLLGDRLGLQMIAAAAALQVIGTLIINRIVDVEY